MDDAHYLTLFNFARYELTSGLACRLIILLYSVTPDHNECPQATKTMHILTH